MSSGVSLATIAEYFRLGLLAGIFTPDQAVAWADREIAASGASLPDGMLECLKSHGPRA